ncbi:hypothetical protein VCSRO169_3540 [Vibrio cholerae]|nr:hypothetical protein VCSRO169_3540 [Vibrio cholerae]
MATKQHWRKPMLNALLLNQLRHNQLLLCHIFFLNLEVVLLCFQLTQYMEFEVNHFLLSQLPIRLSFFEGLHQ